MYFQYIQNVLAQLQSLCGRCFENGVITDHVASNHPSVSTCHNPFITCYNKRSEDLGALLDSCSRDDIGNFLPSADLYEKLTAAD